MKRDGIRRVILEEVTGQVHTRMSLWIAIKDALPMNWRWETFKKFHRQMISDGLLGTTMSRHVTITEDGKRWLVHGR